MRAYARTHVGKTRKTNEDAYYQPVAGEYFAAVADGMGGHLAGEVASWMAINTFAAALRGREATVGALQEALMQANSEVYREARRDSAHKMGMGTTFTALSIKGGHVRVAHVGDSRAYLFRGKALMQMTTDHTLVEEMVRNGTLTPEQARTHPKRNIVMRAIGTNEHVEIDAFLFEDEPGDEWLLCSDGLSNYVSDFALARIMSGPGTYEQRVEKMIDAALEGGGGDNITCMIVTGEERDGA